MQGFVAGPGSCEMQPALDDATVTLDTQELHRRAHAAVHAQRDGDGWWVAPMETALVAVADSQHSPGTRTMAENAYEQLLAWLEKDGPRPLGDDAAAVAMTAKAARELHGGKASLTAQAASLVTLACERSEHLAPLHVALAAWALDPLISDRRAHPWDAMREALRRFSRQGVNEALVLFSEALADERRPAVERRVADAPAVDRTEQCIMVWLLTAAVEVQMERGFGGEEDLGPFLQRRTELLDHLVAAVADEVLVPAAVADYNPFGQAEEEAGGLHLFEAVMLDLALSGELNAQKLITLREAGRRDAASASRRQRTYAGVTALATFVVAGMAVAIAVLAHANTHLWVGSALSLAMLGFSAALLFLRASETRWNLEYLLTTFILEFVLGLVLIAEGIHGKTFFGDDVAALVGIAGLGVPLLAQAGAARVLKK